MACEDLRHVCGKCGFKWPERSAYDELTFEIMRLRDENARMRAGLVTAADEVGRMVFAFDRKDSRRDEVRNMVARINKATTG